MSQKSSLDSVWIEVESLVQGRQIGDARLYDAILLLNQQVQDITLKLQPLIRPAVPVTGVSTALLPPTSFRAASSGVSVRFLWDEVVGTSLYEVREGSDWEHATFRFRTSGLQGDIDPLIYGDYVFLIKSLDSQGLYSEAAAQCVFSVPLIQAPAISVSVIDNNVLLYWTIPTSTFSIDYYVVEKHSEPPTSGRIDGNFTTLFEVSAGTYEYCVFAVDLAGNIGAEAEVKATVSSPPDFALQTTVTSNLNGTRVNVLRVATRPSLLFCIETNTWQTHFTNRSWLDPEDQVTAGYPIYIQPTYLTGSYEEVFDFGLVMQNVILSALWNTINYTPQYEISIIVKMQVSNDGITYTAFDEGSTQYFPSVRYLRLRLEFTSEDNHALQELYHLTINASVKRENDGGEIYAAASDVGGTVVTFNKPFRDIESITCTAKSVSEPFTVIFDFTDIPDPVSFRVYVLDSTGNRVSETVAWKVRGIV